MEIITLAAGVTGLAILAVMALVPVVADLPLPRPARRAVDPAAEPEPRSRRDGAAGRAAHRAVAPAA